MWSGHSGRAGMEDRMAVSPWASCLTFLCRSSHNYKKEIKVEPISRSSYEQSMSPFLKACCPVSNTVVSSHQLLMNNFIILQAQGVFSRAHCW